jgi:hypothetical protein
MYVLEKSDIPISQTGWSRFRLVKGVEICSTELSSAKSDGPVPQTGGSEISISLDNLGETIRSEPDDWRTHLVRYL